MSNQFANIPQELKDRPQWVVWKYGKRKANGKRAKVPFSVTGGAASSTDPTTWATFAECLTEYAKGGYDGVGYILTQDDGYTFIDLDDCIRNDELDAGAMATIRRFASYTERSVSGKGVHILVKGKAANRKNDAAEVYSDKRFIAMTGEIVAEQRTIEARQETLDAWHAETFPAKRPKEAKESPKADSAALPADDDALLRIIRASKGADKFNRLWDGNTSGYTNAKTGKTDPSRADGALCEILAFWTNSDKPRIDRMFRQSGLMRAKWDRTGDAASGRTYGQLTIDNAIAHVTRHYTPSKEKSEVALLVETNRATLANLPMRSATQRVILAIHSYAERENKATLPISSRYIADFTGLSHRSAQMEMRLLCPETRAARTKRLGKDIEKAQERLTQALTATTAQAALSILPAHTQASITAKRGAQGDAAVMAECVIHLQNKIERILTEFKFYQKNEARGNTFDLLTCNKTSDGSALANVYTVGTLQNVSTDGLDTGFVDAPSPPPVTIGHYGNILQSSRDALQFIETNMRDDAFVNVPPVKLDPRLKLAAKNGANAEQLDRMAAMLAPDEKLKPFGLSAPRVLAYLKYYPSADIEAIVNATHLSERTVRTVLKVAGAELVEKGYLPLVEVMRQGRKLTYSLADDWRERLDALRNDLCTNGLIVARTIKHAGERIQRIEQFIKKNQAAPRKRLDETTKAQYEAIRDRARTLQKRLSGGGDVDKSAALAISEALANVESELIAPTINRHYFDYSDAWREWESLKAQGFAARLAKSGEGFVVRL